MTLSASERGLGGALPAVGPGPELLGVVLQAWFDLKLGVA